MNLRAGKVNICLLWIILSEIFLIMIQFGQNMIKWKIHKISRNVEVKTLVFFQIFFGWIEMRRLSILGLSKEFEYSQIDFCFVWRKYDRDKKDKIINFLWTVFEKLEVLNSKIITLSSGLDQEILVLKKIYWRKIFFLWLF